METLSHCSARVQKGARQRPTEKELFAQTLPLRAWETILPW